MATHFPLPLSLLLARVLCLVWFMHTHLSRKHRGTANLSGLTGLANAAAAGCVALAYHVRAMAKYYGVPVVLHTDHCAKKLLPWFDGLLDANKEYFDTFGEPLFSSHMLDLSEEPDEENIEICAKYLKKMTEMKK